MQQLTTSNILDFLRDYPGGSSLLADGAFMDAWHLLPDTAQNLCVTSWKRRPDLLPYCDGASDNKGRTRAFLDSFGTAVVVAINDFDETKTTLACLEELPTAARTLEAAMVDSWIAGKENPGVEDMAAALRQCAKALETSACLYEGAFSRPLKDSK